MNLHHAHIRVVYEPRTDLEGIDVETDERSRWLADRCEVNMRRVLLLGLYYPPANFMAGRRLQGWARHLPDFGYDPLVLTRYYDREARDSHDFYASSRPTKTLRESWVESEGAVYTQFSESFWQRLPVPGKIRGLAHYIWPDPDHSQWYRHCVDYLNRSGYKPDIIIGSYSPAAMFSIAAKLARRFRVPWIADYRDTWIEIFDDHPATRFKYACQRRHLRSASGVTAASEGVVAAVSRQLAPLDIPTQLIYNGAEPFDDVQPSVEDQHALSVFDEIKKRNQIVLTYAGTLYPQQQIEVLLNAVAEFNARNGRSCAIVLCGRHDTARFAGWPFVHLLGPVAHDTALFLQKQSTAGFYPTWWPEKHTGFTGKIFEMILSARPTLVFSTPPPDLVALGNRFKSLSIIKQPEALMKELEQLPNRITGNESDDSLILATKKHAAGQLARFLDRILEVQQEQEVEAA
jgi:hypothetical protein